MKRQRFLIFTFVVVLVASLGATQLLHTLPASAYAPHAGNGPQMTNDNARAGSFVWINRATIKGTFPSSSGVVTITFFDKNITDYTWSYAAQNYACDGTITLHPQKNKDKFGNEILDPTHGDLDLDVIHPNVNADCSNVGAPGTATITNAPLADSGNANYFLQQTDANTIQPVDNGSLAFSNTKSGLPNVYNLIGDTSDCPTSVLVSGTGKNLQYRYIELTDEQPSTPDPTIAKFTTSQLNTSSDCWDVVATGATGTVDSLIPVNTLLPLLTDKTKFTVGITAPTPDASSGDQNCKVGTVACNNTLCDASGISLSWVICPIMNGLADVTDTVFDNVAKPLLQSGSINFTTPGQDSYKVFQVWSNFRIIGNVLLIIALLVIVFGQAIGGGIVDSYTAKKVAPRILIAAVLINLSIYIVALLVDITNILGSGVYALITSPVAASGGLKFTISGGTSGLGVLALVGLGIALMTRVVLPFIPFLLLSILLPAVIALLGVVATLILRRAIIILLVIISPVAFALYCLPNTEKLFRQWWNMLFKTLMVYPITLAIIGAINLLASIIGTANNSGGLAQFFANVTAMILIIMPLFIIPFAFKMSGGLVGGIYNGINGATSGVKKGLRGAALKSAGAAVKKYRANGALDVDEAEGKDKWRKRGNKLGAYIFDFDEKVPHELGKRGVPMFKSAYTRLQSKVDAERTHQTKDLAGTMNEEGINDQGGRVLSGDIYEGMSPTVRDRLERELGVVDPKTGKKEFKGITSDADFDKAIAILDASDEVTERQAAGALRTLKGTVLNLRREGKGYADVRGAGALIVASHGFAREEDVVRAGQLAEEKYGREYADTLMTQMEINGAKSGLKVTYSHSRDKNGKIITGTAAGRDLDRARSKSYSDIAQQKNHGVKSDVKALRETIRLSELTPEELQDEIALWQTDRDEVVTDHTGKAVLDENNQPVMVHMTGWSKDIAENRAKDIKDKARSAVAVLNTIAGTYNPGAGDSNTIAAQALTSIGIKPPDIGTYHGDESLPKNEDDDPPPTVGQPPQPPQGPPGLAPPTMAPPQNPMAPKPF